MGGTSSTREGESLKPEQGQRPLAAEESASPRLEAAGAEVRRLRDELTATRAALRERIADQARLQANSRLAALGTVVAGVAHEVNNPLSGVLASQGFALEALRELRSGILRESRDRGALARDVDAIASALLDAQECGQRIARVVRDLAAFGRFDPARVPVRLEDEVEAAVAWLHPAGATDVRIEREPVPEVLAVPGQILQVVVNLLDNALRAIPPEREGHVVVRIGPGPPGTARVEVSDDGVGMAPAALGRVFDPFFTTRAVGEGRGLGLAVCHAIVAAHGGSITAESEPGKGSTFRVELPLAGGRSAAGGGGASGEAGG